MRNIQYDFAPKMCRAHIQKMVLVSFEVYQTNIQQIYVNIVHSIL